jgi:hypothetical protein
LFSFVNFFSGKGIDLSTTTRKSQSLSSLKFPIALLLNRMILEETIIMEKKISIVLIIVTISLIIAGCGNDSPSEPSGTKSQVEFAEVYTDKDGKGSFVVKNGKLDFKTINGTTGEAIKNVESYLATDGKNAVVLLIDPMWDYIPRLASDRTDIDQPFYSKPAPFSPQYIWTGTKAFTLQLWNDYVKAGDDLVYTDQLPVDPTLEMIHKYFESWKTTNLDKLESTLSEVVNSIVSKDADILITEALFGPEPDKTYLKVTNVTSIKDLVVQSLCQNYSEKYRLKGYKLDQKLEIWRMKISNPKSGSPILIIPSGSPESTPLDSIPPKTSITKSPDDSIDYNDVVFEWEGKDNQSQASELLYCYYLQDDNATGWSSGSPWSSKTTVTYYNLNQGNYVFYVKSKDKADNVELDPVTKKFTITKSPPNEPQIEININADNFNVGDIIHAFYRSKKGIENNIVNVYILFESLQSGRRYYFYNNPGNKAPEWLVKKLASLNTGRLEIKDFPKKAPRPAPSSSPVENWMNEAQGWYLNNWKVENNSGELFSYEIGPDFPSGSYRLHVWLTKFDTGYSEVLGKESSVTFSMDTPAESCFIATAAYGTPLAEEVQVLRCFRDKYLLTNWFGSTFVNIYYRVSPPIANYISPHDFLKRMTRVGLRPIIWVAEFLLRATLFQKTIILILSSLSLVGLLIVLRKKIRSLGKISTLVILLLGTSYIVSGCGDSENTLPTMGNTPTVNIISPANGASFSEGESIEFVGSATGTNIDVIANSSLIWKSDVDGNIGEGRGFRASNLSVGKHKIELIGSDNKEKKSIDTATIEILEASPGDVLIILPAPGDCPTGLTYDGKDLWVADDFQDKIYKVDPCTGLVISSFASPGPEPSGLAWDGNCLWSADLSDDKISKISFPGATIVNSFPSPASHPAALTWDGNYLWTSDLAEKKIYKVDSSNGSVVTSFYSPGDYPNGLAWDGNFLWVVDVWTHGLYQVDPSDGSVITSFTAPGTWHRGLAWDGKYLWLVDSAEKNLYKIKVPVSK